MHIIGLIAEYNPFHNGHLYQINKIKKQYPDSLLIAVLSSSFTERGDISILNKWDKTNIALENGIDIVIELPFVYATQSSDIFAKGAISLLEKLKIDTLVFGTESDSLDILTQVADLQLNNDQYDTLVKKYLNEGMNYPTATNKAISSLLGFKIDAPNDLLALSYIKEIKKNNYQIKVHNIKRTNSYYSVNIIDNIASATHIRDIFLKNQDISSLIPYSPKILTKVNMEAAFPYLKYKIISDESKLNAYQTVDEGIENRIIREINNATNYEDLISRIKTKRYTYNKISRLLLHILTNFTKTEAQNINIDYLRILGFTNNGKNYLNKIKKDIPIPILTGYKKNTSKVLDKELQVTKIYSLITNNNDLIIREYQKKPIIKN